MSKKKLIILGSAIIVVIAGIALYAGISGKGKAVETAEAEESELIEEPTPEPTEEPTPKPTATPAPTATPTPAVDISDTSESDLSSSESEISNSESTLSMDAIGVDSVLEEGEYDEVTDNVDLDTTSTQSTSQTDDTQETESSTPEVTDEQYNSIAEAVYQEYLRQIGASTAAPTTTEMIPGGTPDDPSKNDKGPSFGSTNLDPAEFGQYHLQ